MIGSDSHGRSHPGDTFRLGYVCSLGAVGSTRITARATRRMRRRSRSDAPAGDPTHLRTHLMTSTQQALCRNTNATGIASIHHRHRRPPPAHTFTPYPPIHLADLSRPAARQPSHPASPSPNCSRHAAAIAHTSGQYCCPPIMLVFSRNPLGGPNPYIRRTGPSRI